MSHFTQNLVKSSKLFNKHGNQCEFSVKLMMCSACTCSMQLTVNKLFPALLLLLNIMLRHGSHNQIKVNMKFVLTHITLSDCLFWYTLRSC